MRARRRAVALVLGSVTAFGAGCTATPPPTTTGSVALDTPELRALKADAGLEECPSPTEAGGGELPAVSVACLGGGPAVDLSGLRGPMMINFFASWCGPCKKEMPLIAEFARDRKDEIAVLGIDEMDQQPAAALELARDSGVTYPVLADPSGELSGKSPLPVIKGMPFWVFLDADGRVVHQEFRAVNSRAELDELVAIHLGGS